MIGESDDRVPVCPECDSAQIRSRSRRPKWRCWAVDCRAEFDEPCLRERHSPGVSADSQLKQIGVDMQKVKQFREGLENE